MCAINHSIDDRYGEKVISTHNKIKIPSINTDKLYLKHDEIIENKVLFINEGQFFEDLYDFVNDMLGQDKIVFVCGLDEITNAKNSALF